MNSGNYITSKQAAELWHISERSVRNYCTLGRVPGSVIEGKTWLIPQKAEKPLRQIRHSVKKETLLNVLRREKEASHAGGIYHRLQIDLTYNSNHIEGSALTHDQTRYIFETKTIGITDESVNVDDIIETVNHFRCIDLVIDAASTKLTESFIKQLHLVLKTGTSDSRKSWCKVGAYKMLENEVGGQQTAKPSEVSNNMKILLKEYTDIKNPDFDDILNFHVRFELIHPFQDGNGRVGRLIILKECLKNNIVPFIITEQLKMFYYRGVHEWNNERGYLRDTCLTGQDAFKEILNYFNIPFN